MTHHPAPDTPMAPTRGLLLRRAVACRCPHCGDGPVFSGFVAMHERCPTCGYRFVRESGYFLGAMVINYAVVGALTLLAALVAYLLTRDQVWTIVTAIVVTIVGVPAFLRHSRTLWMALDLSAEPPRPDEFPPT